MLTRRRFSVLAAAGSLSACGRSEPAPPQSVPIRGTLEWAVAGVWRLEPERDRYRNPVETLRFFEVQATHTVLEVYPGQGWWTTILAPYLREGGGQLIVAGFDPATASPAQQAVTDSFNSRFSDAALFGTIQRVPFSKTSPALTTRGRCDRVLIMRNLHTFMAEGWVEKALRDVFDALKPGGILGIEQHRAASTGVQDPTAGNGYVQESYVQALCAEVGFTFLESSEINANPKDGRDHPFGVWTLPPVLRTSPPGQPDDPAFDTAPYVDIGESDRMTLKFQKPDPRGGALGKQGEASRP